MKEEEEFIDFHTTPRGMCWLMYCDTFGGGCDWWNPPEEWIGDDSTKPKGYDDFIIQFDTLLEE